MSKSIFAEFRNRFSSSFSHHSSINKPKISFPIIMSTPATSSFSSDIKAVEQSLENLFTYTVSTAVSHIKTEIENLESFVASKTKLVSKNNDTIASLQSENTSHTADIAKATDTANKLKSAITT